MVLRVEPMYGEKEKDINYDKMKFMFVHRTFESHCAMVNGVNSEGRNLVYDEQQPTKKIERGKPKKGYESHFHFIGC